MNSTIDMLSKVMDVAALRHKVIANNLANVNTPGYQRKDVKFVDALAAAIEKGPVHVKDLTFDVMVDELAVPDARGNSVSLQREVGEIAQNELLYNFAAEMTSRKFSGLSKAISGTK